MLAKTGKNILRGGFNYFGLEINRKSGKDAPPPVYANVDDVIYANKVGIAASYECGLRNLLSVSGFSFSQTGWHPFVEALKYHELTGRGANYSGSYLEQFYKNWRPESAKEACAGFDSAPDELAEIPAYAIHGPWTETTIQQRHELMKNTIEMENKWAGHPGLGAGAGYGLNGPVTPEKGELENTRLWDVYTSIKKRGYDRALLNEDIRVTAIEMENAYRFCVMHGHHRVAALAALNVASVPVRITKVVRHNEVMHWPQVYKGPWTKESAEKYVEHLFHFDSRAWAVKKGLDLDRILLAEKATG